MSLKNSWGESSFRKTQDTHNHTVRKYKTTALQRCVSSWIKLHISTFTKYIYIKKLSGLFAFIGSKMLIYHECKTHLSALLLMWQSQSHHSISFYSSWGFFTPIDDIQNSSIKINVLHIKAPVQKLFNFFCLHQSSCWGPRYNAD